MLCDQCRCVFMKVAVELETANLHLSLCSHSLGCRLSRHQALVAWTCPLQAQAQMLCHQSLWAALPSAEAEWHRCEPAWGVCGSLAMRALSL